MSVGRRGFVVTECVDGAHPLHSDYPLLLGDLLVKDKGRSFTKEAPGLCVRGFRLTPEQVATLRPVTFTCLGLNYAVTEVTP